MSPKKKKKSSKKKSKKKKKSAKKDEDGKENQNENMPSKNNLRSGSHSPVQAREHLPAPSPKSKASEELQRSPIASPLKKENDHEQAEPVVERKKPEEARKNEPRQEETLSALMKFGQPGYKRDCTKNTSWFDTQDLKTKIKIRIVIPDYIGPHLQRKNNLLGRIESEHGCKLAFVADTESRVSTCEGIKGSLVQFAGEMPQVMSAMRALLEEIIDTEQELNGKRKS